jgi:hypothetical protein
MNELYKRTLWINKNIEFLFDTEIIEYDIHAAGPSICREFKLLPESLLDEIDKMDKKSKNIKIGLIQRKDKEFAKKLQNGFITARKWFIEANEISEDDIISIKKDAFFIARRNCSKVDFGNIHFRSKNFYSSYFRLNKLEFYVSTSKHIIDIKGLGQGKSLEEIKELHGDYMLSFIMKFCLYKEVGIQRDDVAIKIAKFIRRYRNKELPIGYYRELGFGNAYKVFDPELNHYIFLADIGEDADLSNLDISTNYLNYIVPLASLYS